MATARVVLSIINECCSGLDGTDPPTLASSLADIGFDSLRATVLQMKLEERFCITIVADAVDLPTPRAIVAHVTERLAARVLEIVLDTAHGLDGLATVNMDSRLADLGFDSLRSTVLQSRLEEAFAVSLTHPPEELPTARVIVRHIADLIASMDQRCDATKDTSLHVGAVSSNDITKVHAGSGKSDLAHCHATSTCDHPSVRDDWTSSLISDLASAVTLTAEMIPCCLGSSGCLAAFLPSAWALGSVTKGEGSAEYERIPLTQGRKTHS